MKAEGKAEGTEQGERILTLTPTGRDAALLADALARAGLHAEDCADVDALCRAMTPLAAAVLIASEALTPSSLAQIRAALAQQPPWSDLPLIILTSGGRDPRERGPWAEALDALGNTTLLERPLRMATLIHAAQAALGARRRQYEVRGLLEEHARMERHLQAEARKQRAFLRDVLASVTGGRLLLCDTPADLPARLPLSGPPVPLTRTGGMSELRRAAKEAALAEGFAADRWQDLLTAVGEAAMNAAVHGGGGVGRVCTGRDGIVQVWVEDRGRGIEVEDLPRATLSKGYTTAGSLGHGMKMMLETVDRLWLLTGPAGTTAVIEQDRRPPQPAWSKASALEPQPGDTMGAVDAME